MTLDLNKRITALQKRRVVEDDTRAEIAKDAARKDSTDWTVARKTERYQERSAAGTAVRYALGSLQEVDPDYTRNSILDAQRVKGQLLDRLPRRGINVSFEDQGSVPLNIHIRGASDVDFLVLHGGFIRVDWNGPRANGYTSLGGTAIERMLQLRRACETELAAAYPAAAVDINGAKSVSLTGGSLKRKVDVVPAHWFDSADYQRTGLKRDRYVSVLDKHVPELLENRPFLYMAEIEAKDKVSMGGAKKTTRLLKSLRTDSDYEIELTSYDIASLVWHMDSAKMATQWYQEISLVGVALAHLRYWSVNDTPAKALMTPDGSRKILDDATKYQSLRYLTSDLEELAVEIARELDPLTTIYPTHIPKVLAEARV